MHDQIVCDQLNGIEFFFFCYLEWTGFSPENAKQVIAHLPDEGCEKSFSFDHIVPSDRGKKHTEKKKKVRNGKQDTCSTVKIYSNIEPYQGIIWVGILHAYSGNDQKDHQYSIRMMPHP
jgi:hypothetical protein